MNRSWIRNTVGLVIIAGLIVYLFMSRLELEHLVSIRPGVLALAYVAALAGTLIAAAGVQALLHTLSPTVGYTEMLVLNTAAVFLNYLPMKAGTIVRANYLRRRHGLNYSQFGVFFVFRSLLAGGTSAAVSAAILLVVFDPTRPEVQLLCGAFFAVLLAAVILLFVPLPIPTGQGKLASSLRGFLLGRRRLGRSRKALVVSTGLLVVNFGIDATRLHLVYRSLGVQLHPAAYLVLAGVGFVVMITGLTPGGLGLREAMLGAAAALMGPAGELGVLAALVDRALLMTWTLIAGGGCATVLWLRYPQATRTAADRTDALVDQ
jgi:uncharacterized membrane protein YbhN (UPF0104 family)